MGLCRPPVVGDFPVSRLSLGAHKSNRTVISMPSNFDNVYPAPIKIIRPSGVVLTNSTVPDALRNAQVVTGVKRRKPSGWINPTGYDLYYRSSQRAIGKISDLTKPYNPSLGTISTGCLGATLWNSYQRWDDVLTEANLMDPWLANAALIEARNKLKSTDINLGVAFAERAQTARLLGSTASSIAKSYTALRHGKIRHAMNLLGISSSRSQPRGSNAPRKWLELQYGWKPLLSDVFGACEALSKRDKTDWRVTAKSTKQGTYTNSKTYGNVSVRTPGSSRVQVRRGAFVRIDALPANETLISLASVGVTNPLLIAWELVPFSFVVDWAFPVGSWLESLDAYLGYSSATTSTSQLVRAEWFEEGGDYENSSWHTFGQWTGGKRVVRLVRSVANGVPLPHFPRIKDPFSFQHMANGLSLLATAFGKR